MGHRIDPEDQERQRQEHDSRRERFEHELAERERIAEHGSMPVDDPDVARLARIVAERRRPALRLIEGGGIKSDPDVPAALAVAALSERTLRGMSREITARLAEIQLGGAEGRRLGALSRAVRGELTRRAVQASPPRRPA